MRDKTPQTPPAPQRPLASEAEIQAMQERATAHRHAADMHEAKAQHEIAGAEHMAGEMVANAQAKANELVREANQSAAALERQADERAKGMRAEKAIEEQKAQFWKSLAAEEAARAGLTLTPVPPTAPMEPVTGVTRTDNEVPS